MKSIVSQPAQTLKRILAASFILAFSSLPTLASPESGFIDALNNSNLDEKRKMVSILYDIGENQAQIMAKCAEQLQKLLQQSNITKAESDYTLSLIKALSASSNPQHLTLLEKARQSDSRKVRSQAKKSIKKIKSRIESLPLLEEINKTYTSFSTNIGVLTWMTQSSWEYSQEVAWQDLYTARVVSKKKSELGDYTLIPLSLDELTKALSSENSRDRKIAAQRVFYLGVKNSDIHKAIASRIQLLTTEIKSGITTNVDEASWFAKALSASANSNYIPVLEALKQAGNSKAEFYAEHAQSMLNMFKSWYEALDQIADIQNIRIIDFQILMLKAPYLSTKDPSMIYLINHHQETEQVRSLCAQTIAAEWPFVRRNARQVRPAARMLQVLSRSGNPQYLELIREAQNSPSKHLQAHALDAEKQLLRSIK
ncbi:hypothetical protein [Agaribacterium sp. ZY112]|uniref:hypothetical protein n=1 Tax=Agaribacterium sp. ZY112 TaxID=3233574 RepID=UPI003526B7D3